MGKPKKNPWDKKPHDKHDDKDNHDNGIDWGDVMPDGDGMKKAKIDVDVDLDADVDIDTSHTDTKIWVKAETDEVDAKVTIKDIDIDIDKDVNISKWDVEVDVKANTLLQGLEADKVVLDNDTNDVDNSGLINVKSATINMDDFSSDQFAIGNSFNGSGNDSQYNVNQSNDMNDDDTVNKAGVAKYDPHDPNIEQKIIAPVHSDADAGALALAAAKQDADGGKGGDGGDSKGDGGRPSPSWKYDHKKKGDDKGDGGDGGDGGKGGLNINAAVAGAVAINKADIDVTNKNIINADDGEPFQKVTAKGGDATSGNGIKGDSNADDNSEDGTVNGSTTATADALADATAFTADVFTGGNQQANFADLSIVNGDDNANGGGYGHKGHGTKDDKDGYDGGADGLVVKDGWIGHLETDNDVNDLDTANLINAEAGGLLNMDDFDLDITAIGNSFNGPGNDMQFSFDQANDLSDNDTVNAAGNVAYHGTFLDGPFQQVQATGGTSATGDGILGNSSASGNGSDGTVAGSAVASSDAIATAQAFTANVVVGANVQVNNFAANVVGGDSFDDDLS